MKHLNVIVDHCNYIPELHDGKFPQIEHCTVISKDNFLNVILKTTKEINQLVDDIGFDDNGRFISLTFYQWHHKVNGNKINIEDILDSEEYDDIYENVSTAIKIYTKTTYLPFVNQTGTKIVINFVPYDLVNFDEKNCTMVHYKT
jgi:hypothetical protein